MGILDPPLTTEQRNDLNLTVVVNALDMKLVSSDFRGTVVRQRQNR